MLWSPKFVAACVVVTAAVLLAVGLGLQEYRTFADQQNAAQRLLEEEQRQTTDWMTLRQRVFRTADPMQIFVAGVHRDVGRYALVGRAADTSLRHSVYGDEPVFAVFRTFDLAFVVTVVLSLFAVVFTYDAVSGEREAGTLRLLSAYAVPRSLILSAKAAGLWLALVVPTALSGLLGLAVVLAAGVHLDAQDWMRLGVFAGASVLYLSLFALLGLAMSTLTRRSTTSFLGLLAIWVVTVLVLPRAGLVLAVQMVDVPSAATIEAQRAGFENRAWDRHLEDLEARWSERSRPMEGMTPEERQEYEDERMWQWMQEDDAARRGVETEIQDQADRLAETARLRREEQRRLAFGLARLSPAAAYQLVATATAGTGVDMVGRWQQAIREYHGVFRDWLEQESGSSGTHVMRRSGGGGAFSDTPTPIELRGMPHFQPPAISIAEALREAPLDLGLLAIEALLAFAVALMGFLRYDVR
ncbi:MAG: ABC transporter permease subunit [Thermoanaerobaculia bacterium]|nr:ABC transporter permease subunit [Thermoanaerobaculia bacterium]